MNKSPEVLTPAPTNVALVDDDLLFTQSLAQHLANAGMTVSVFGNATELLTSARPFSYDFYVVDLMLPGVDGVSLIDALRRRTSAGVLVVSGRLGVDTFKEVVQVGADMYLAKPVELDQVSVAIAAVHRRVSAATTGQLIWRLDRQAGQLIAPDGVRIDLSEQDQALIECFAQAKGQPVSREALSIRLGKPTPPDAVGGLNGTVFRLRRRIERATDAAMPLQAKSGFGYVFRAPLQVV
ncbi:MAG TPA: response regulator transcription factor [Burkholderiaceae bacterium]|nr:response regulator transcription factor [Burkholderiaceae bacterium]